MVVLSLDLEGVFITSALLFTYSKEGTPCTYYAPRPHTGEFFRECFLSDYKIYMNTCVDEDKVAFIMPRLGCVEYTYWQWDKISNSKLSRMQQLARDNMVIHIEDGITGADMNYACSFGIKTISVRTYEKYDPFDRVLLEVKSKIERIVLEKS